MPRSRPHLLAAAILIVAVLISLCLMAPRMYPLHHDNSANFWYATTAVDLGAANPHVQYAIVDRDRIVYGMQWPFAAYMDEPYLTISLREAQADLPAVERELARRAALHDPTDYYATAYEKWAALYPPSRTVPALLSFIDGERKAASPYPVQFQQGLRHVSQTARLYGATFLFEALLFPALILFAFWPYIHHATFRRKILHLALLPLLLYLPAWFGYCNSASPAFPRGGILYPFCHFPMLALFTNRDWEISFLAYLPPFLIAITQGRTLSYADYYWWKNSVPNQPGPINVAVLSAISVALAIGCHAIAIFYQKRRKPPRGFPVEIHPSPETT